MIPDRLWLIVFVGTVACGCARGKGGGAQAAASAQAACPAGGDRLAAADPRLLVDDFAGAGGLDGRTRAGAGFSVREQFQATPDARFDPAPGLDGACGGAVHIKGTAGGTGATFTLVFSSGGAAGAAPAALYDARASKGFTFRAARGDARATRLHTVEVGLLGSRWSYAKDFVLDGNAWQKVDVAWSDLQAAPGAPPFSPASLNQIVFPLLGGAPIDLFLDDLAFLP